MSKEIKSHSYLDKLAPYQSAGGKLECDGEVIRLCFNEGAFGPNPKVAGAIAAAAPNMHIYPDMGYNALRRALADKYGLDPARIVCGAGSDDIINLLVRAFAGEGDEVVTNQYGFAMYQLAAKAVGAHPVLVPETQDLRADLDAMLAAMNAKTRMAFLANPNNPTGSWLARKEMESFISRLPPHVLFVYDAAYADYMEDPDYSDGFEWVGETGQVCVTRTFSKIHGLGGLRVGWAYATQKVAQALNRIRNPFNVAAASEVGALTSLQDDAFLDSVRVHTRIWRERLTGELTRLGLKPYPSCCNFILVRFPSVAVADAVFHHLKTERRILLRPMAGYGLPDCLRISIGSECEMKALFEALNDYAACHPFH